MIRVPERLLVRPHIQCTLVNLIHHFYSIAGLSFFICHIMKNIHQDDVDYNKVLKKKFDEVDTKTSCVSI